MTWLRELLQDDSSRLLSTARAIALAAGWSLSSSLVLLTIGSFWHIEMLGTVQVIAPTVGVLAGAAYGVNRWATKETKSDPVS